ncbi:hypothetical protein [Variovorax sp. E3]|uniref:hypothetical protein n=1 Tax=Variovorax sp. E3 TaxID=1914993 RepID=UPI0018DEBF2A|nr:hypothetical protein [Variovorax sp. E3]
MQQQSNKRFRISRGLLAAFVIVAFGGAGVLVSLYGIEWFGSPGKRCHDSCALQGKEGVMARVYPKEMTGSRDGSMVCHCR